MAVLIEANGKMTEVKPANGRVFCLEEMQSLVGGYIEMIPALDDLHLVINEEGKLQDLPVNDTATDLATGLAFEDFVVGTVVLARWDELQEPDD